MEEGCDRRRDGANRSWNLGNGTYIHQHRRQIHARRHRCPVDQLERMCSMGEALESPFGKRVEKCVMAGNVCRKRGEIGV